MRLRSGVAIDLGTVNTLVSVAGRGLIIDEPSAIAIDRANGHVAAVGTAADALAGKEPQNVEVVHPLRNGVVADLQAASAMLQGFLRRAKVRRGLLRTSAVICVPGGATWVERRSLVAALGAVRPRCTVQLIDEPVAAAAGAGFDLAAGPACSSWTWAAARPRRRWWPAARSSGPSRCGWAATRWTTRSWPRSRPNWG